jgi:hypothetical protein
MGHEMLPQEFGCVYYLRSRAKARDCWQNALTRADMKSLLPFSGIVTRFVVTRPS